VCRRAVIAIVLLGLLAVQVESTLAADATAVPPPAVENAARTPEKTWVKVLQYLADHAFGIAILLVFVTAIVSSYLSRRLSDRCLKDFEGYPVTLEFKDGRRESGVLDAENNGLEICYAGPMPASDGPPRTSTLLYQTEYAQMQAIIRYNYALTETQLERRLKALKRALAPGFFRRLWRKVRNFFAAIADAFTEAFTLILGRLKSVGPQAALLRTQDRYVSRVGTQVIGATITASFDPLLEKDVMRRVVVELLAQENRKLYLEGLLREYTKDFLELHDVAYPDVWTETLTPARATSERQGVIVRRSRDRIEIENNGEAEVMVEALGDENRAPLRVAPGGQGTVPLPAPDATVALRLSSPRQADLLLPRHSAVVRGRVPDGTC